MLPRYLLVAMSCIRMQRLVSKAIVLIAFAVVGFVESQEILGFTDEIILSHGGKIKGLQILSHQTPVDLFLGE